MNILVLDDLRALLTAPDSASVWDVPTGYWLGVDTDVEMTFMHSISGQEPRRGRKCRRVRPLSY
jgi:hypothetical protein